MKKNVLSKEKRRKNLKINSVGSSTPLLIQN